jgi:hypothetical protein
MQPAAKVRPQLDDWLPDPAVRVVHRRESSASTDELWRAAREVSLSETAMLGRLLRLRIPGLARDLSYDALFREPPFVVLEEGEHLLVSGLAGRIWTLRRDYPELRSAEEFCNWSERGTAAARRWHPRPACSRSAPRAGSAWRRSARSSPAFSIWSAARAFARLFAVQRRAELSSQPHKAPI